MGGIVDRFVAFAGNSRIGEFSEKVTGALVPLEIASASDGFGDCGPDSGFCSGTGCGGYGVWVIEYYYCRNGACVPGWSSTGICC